MAGRFITVQCAACQCDITVGCTKRQPALCQQCRIDRYVQNLASLKQKSGEPYERNKAAIQAAWNRRRRGGTSPT